MGKIINPNMIERFVEIYLTGMPMTDIANTLGVNRSTVYDWLNRDDVKAEVESRQREIRDAGMQFIKARYYKYLNNIDKLCDNFEDKRTALASNQFMVEKMDGKNTAKLEVKDTSREDEPVDVLAEIEDFEELEEENTR